MRRVSTQPLDSLAVNLTGIFESLLARPRIMDTSLISALIGAQVGEMQLAVAARLAHIDAPGTASPISQLVNAANQSADALANVAADIGTNLDVSA
jgi:hypothetical protein